MANDHVQDLFSAASDGELSSEQWLRFKEHLATCAGCTDAYGTFRTGVDSVRLLPAARMPLPVHLPGGAPQAQRRSASAWLRGLRRMPLVPGGATAVAAVAAAAIALIALTHPAGGPTLTAGGGARSGTNNALAPSVQASCPSEVPAGAAAAETVYSYRETKTDPSRPGQELVLAAGSATARAGSPLSIYARLSVPVPTAGAPGAHAPAVSTAVVPCLSFTGLPGSVQVSPASGSSTGGSAPPLTDAPPNHAQPQSAAGGLEPAFEPAGLETITIPPGTPAGTVLRIMATVPAGYPSPGDPAMSIELTITVS